MKRAPIKQYPCDREGPGETELVPKREGKNESDDRADEQAWQDGLRDALGRRRPELLAIFDRLSSSQKESADYTQETERHPVKTEGNGGLNLESGTDDTSHNAK